MIPVITRETSFGWHVSKLGVNIFDLDFWLQVNSVEQPINCDTVGCGQMSHCWTSSFDNHLDESFVVFEYEQLRLTLRKVCVCVYVVHI